MESPFSDMDWLDTAARTLDIAIQTGLYTDFGRLKSDLDRVRFMHTNRTCLLADTLERYLTTNCTTKNPLAATNFRKQGNEYFVSKNLSRAAWCYRASIALSTMNSQDMALSYGNLSAVLFELNHYHESIRAIQLATDAYPNELKFKLVFRRAACYHKLNDPERSAQELKICRDLIKKTAGLDRKKIDSFCKEMDQLSRQTALLNKRKEEQQQQTTTESYKNLDDLVERSQSPAETLAASLSSSSQKRIDGDFCPPSPPSPPRSTILIDESKLLFNGSNERVPCASSSLRVAYSIDKGRHIITTRDIPPDALVLSERPYACLLLPKFAYTYCDHCLTTIVIPYVCSQCSHVLFCSEHCQKQALNSYHQFECKHIHILKTLGIGFLAYRTLTITDLETLWTTLTHAATIPNENNHSEKNPIYKSDYIAVQQLLTHTEHMSIDDLFHYSLTAYLLSEIVKRTEFLQCHDSTKRDTEQILLASVLLKHIQQMICNAQTISITSEMKTRNGNRMDEIEIGEDDEEEDDGESTKRFASAIFPTCALMNHSCVPNIRCVFDQGLLRVHTARWVREGEEIFNCYGPQKSLMPSTSQRQAALFEQYFFKCQCEGCVDLVKPQINGRKMKSTATRKLHNHKAIMVESIVQQTPSTINDDVTRFYLTSTEKLREAKRLFTQGLSSFTSQSHSSSSSSWEHGFIFLDDAIHLYERIIRDLNLDTVHLYEYVASIYNDRQQFDQTCVYLNKCISILKINLSTSCCSSTTILLVDILRKYAQTLFHCRKFDDARRTIAEAQFLLDQMSPPSTAIAISHISEEEKRTVTVLQTMEDLKAQCDLCVG